MDGVRNEWMGEGWKEGEMDGRRDGWREVEMEGRMDEGVRDGCIYGGGERLGEG